MSNLSFVNKVLKPIFKHEAIIVIIKGFWKTGKTNVALAIVEMLLESGIINVAGTNIKIKETETIKFIEDFESLKQFHFDDPNRPKHKAFIFDEAGKLTVRRRAMGRFNVGWMSFIPELSKGRMKLIVVTQAEFLTDSIFIDTEFTRATITTFHNPQYGYSIQIESDLIDREWDRNYINKFPKCKIKYSPYEPAEWYMEKRDTPSEQKEMFCCKIARMYAVEKLSTTKIANKFGYKTRTEVVKLIKRHIRHTFKEQTKEDIEELLKEIQKPELEQPITI